MSLLAIAYCAMTVLMIIYNHIKLHRAFNALNVYLITWSAMVALYGMRLINYYTTAYITWIVVFVATILVFSGFHLGRRIEVLSNGDNDSIDEDKLKRAIIKTSLFSSLAIIPNTFFLIQRYGINLLSKTTEIYYDNITGNATFSIPYISAVVYVACILAGIYFAAFGFNKILVLPVALAMLAILPSGSRGWLILSVFFIILPMLMIKGNRANTEERIKKQNKIMIIIAVIAVLALFIVLTINRSKNLDPTIYQFISPRMLPVACAAPWVFKLYQYFASPVGVLNAFLINPTFYFGENTFGVFYNLFNKFGFDFQYSRYQTFYHIPIETNVGTWLLELSHDFTVLGMFIVVFLFAMLVGYYEKKAILTRQVNDILLATTLETMLIMSFFVWYLREGTMVVVILTCLFFKFKTNINMRKTKITI